MKGRKTGGRLKGSLNIGTRSLGRKRERVRRDATVAIQEAMPMLRKWLADAETWKSDGAQAARMLDALMKWVVPAYGRIDPHAEQAEQAAVQRAEPPAMTPAQLLAAFKAMPNPAATPTSGEGPQALERQPDQALEHLSDAESQVTRHSGIPLPESGMAYLPKTPPMAKRREPGALPPLPKRAIEHESPEEPPASSARESVESRYEHLRRIQEEHPLPPPTGPQRIL